MNEGGFVRVCVCVCVCVLQSWLCLVCNSDFFNVALRDTNNFYPVGISFSSVVLVCKRV